MPSKGPICSRVLARVSIQTSSSVHFDGSDTTDGPNAFDTPKHLLAKTLDAYEQGPKTTIEIPPEIQRKLGAESLRLSIVHAHAFRTDSFCARVDGVTQQILNHCKTSERSGLALWISLGRDLRQGAGYGLRCIVDSESKRFDHKSDIFGLSKSSRKSAVSTMRLQGMGALTQNNFAWELSRGEDDTPTLTAQIASSADITGLTFKFGHRTEPRLARLGFEPLSLIQGLNDYRPNFKPEYAVMKSAVDLVAKELAEWPDNGIASFIRITHSLAREMPFHTTYSCNMQLNASDVRQMAGEGVDLSNNLLLNLRTSPLIRGGRFTFPSPWEMQITFPDVHVMHEPDFTQASGSARESRSTRVKTRCTAILQDPRHEISSSDLGHALIKETMTSLRDIAKSALGTPLKEFSDSFDSDPSARADQYFAERIAARLASDTSWLVSGLRLKEIDVSVGTWKESDILGHASAQAAQNVLESDQPPSQLLHNTTPASDSVYVALGSNVGDRLEAIEAACRAIDEDQDMRILSTSALYETEPMYVENQERFLNGACEIRTELPPLQLLDRLQALEKSLGRVKTIEKGPRSIDLDILLYKGQEYVSDRLTIPHALMTEREFVMRPLRNIHPRGSLTPLKRSANGYLESLRRSADPDSSPSMYSYTPTGPISDPLTPMNPKQRTRVMSILNTTPDSFSDGGVNSPNDLAALRESIRQHVQDGATIIDIGGQSSRPNAPDVTAEEEIARVVPAIEAFKLLGPEAEGVAISVDTYRAAVAEAAIKAGAHIINDISFGLLDEDMLPTVARLGCTYIGMHMRGTPATMQDKENTEYPDGVVETVARELAARVEAAQAAGIRRWRLILDPGVGFAKTQEQNLELLRRLPDLIHHGRIQNFPWMVGSSRKGFIGQITGVAEARERSWGTAATVTAAVAGGADVVRVHDVAEMAKVVKMSDALYRV
ncbi:folic acid synthesis protein [Hortaea werneckii]|nr:folic acid synthesis protein [Hortaea werneckii]